LNLRLGGLTVVFAQWGSIQKTPERDPRIPPQGEKGEDHPPPQSRGGSVEAAVERVLQERDEKS
jgi:hypothetical protein